MDAEEPTRTGLDIDRLFFAVDMATRAILDVDHRLTQTTGWSANELFGRSWDDLIHPADVDDVHTATAYAKEHGSCRWTCRILHQDESWVYYQCEGTLGADGMSYYIAAADAHALAAHEADSWQWARFGELAEDLFVVSDIKGRILTVNDAVERVHGIPREEVIGRSVTQFVPPSTLEKLGQISAQGLAGEEKIRHRIEALDANGDEIILDCIFTFDERTQRWYTLERDVTQRVTHERELEITSRFFELSGSHLALVDLDGTILRANPALIHFSGLDEDSLKGASLLAVFGSSARSPLAQAFHRVASSEGTENLIAEVTSNSPGAIPGGERRMLSVTLMHNRENTAIFFSGRDVTEEQRLAAELFDRATHDPLTRLASRDVFIDALTGQVDAGFSATVMMIDLDEFKRINDALGHAAGDELLIKIGRRLQEAARPDDVIARFGGDEFVVLMRAVKDDQSALVAAEKLRTAVAEPFTIDGRTVHITLSVGVAVGEPRSQSPSLLIRQADSAAYAAKRSGRNRVRVFDTRLEEHLRHEAHMERELRAALAHDRIGADVQCVFNTDGSLKGVEVLRRIVAENGDRIGPHEYLPVAKKLGLAGVVGEQLVDRALAQATDWLAADRTRVLSFNADPHELLVPSYVDILLGAIERHNIDPRQLLLEVTEGGFGPAGRHSVDVLERLRSAGLMIAIDDFGTGASSLSVLRDLNLDVVKVDPSFGAALPDDLVADAITGSIVSLACDLGLSVVVSGLTNPEALDDLRDSDRHLFLQGPLLHQPEPMEQFFARSVTGSTAGFRSAVDVPRRTS